MGGWNTVPPEITLSLVSVLFAALVYFLRLWGTQRVREERNLHAELVLLREALKNLESRVNLHDDCLREGRTTFQDLRKEMQGKIGKEVCVEKHESSDRLLERLESAVKDLRLELIDSQQTLIDRIDKVRS